VKFKPGDHIIRSGVLLSGIEKRGRIMGIDNDTYHIIWDDEDFITYWGYEYIKKYYELDTKVMRNKTLSELLK